MVCRCVRVEEERNTDCTAHQSTWQQTTSRPGRRFGSGRTMDTRSALQVYSSVLPVTHQPTVAQPRGSTGSKHMTQQRTTSVYRWVILCGLRGKTSSPAPMRRLHAAADASLRRGRNTQHGVKTLPSSYNRVFTLAFANPVLTSSRTHGAHHAGCGSACNVLTSTQANVTVASDTLCPTLTLIQMLTPITSQIAVLEMWAVVRWQHTLPPVLPRNVLLPLQLKRDRAMDGPFPP